MEPERVLLIVLSTAFLILLVLVIVFVVVLIKILSAIRRITNRAEDATESLSSMLKMVGKRIAPVALSTLAAAAFKKVKSKK